MNNKSDAPKCFLAKFSGFRFNLSNISYCQNFPYFSCIIKGPPIWEINIIMATRYNNLIKTEKEREWFSAIRGRLVLQIVLANRDHSTNQKVHFFY